MFTHPFKIGFDAKRAMNNLTGLGNYSRVLIETLCKRHPDNAFFGYAPAFKENPRLEKINSLDNFFWRVPQKKSITAAWWRSFGIINNLRNDGIEIYHGLSNELPLNIRQSGVKSIVTIHDLIYRTVPDNYKPGDRLIYDYKYRKSCINADIIIAISECTKRDIVSYYGIDEEKIRVVYQGCDEQFKRILTPQELQETKKQFSLPDKYIIQVGTIEKRKNLELTVRALSALSPGCDLVVVGKDHNGYKQRVVQIAEDLGILSRIHFYEGVPFSALPGFYQNAEVVVYPSRYEGFGIPVLEGLNSRRPVIAATGSCLEEAGGKAALYVNPDSEREITEALNATMNKSPEINARIEEGVKHAQKFGGTAMADTIFSIYEELKFSR